MTPTIKFTAKVWGSNGWEWMCDGIASNHPETGWGQTEAEAIQDFYKQCEKAST